jgi:hypothetical protein
MQFWENQKGSRVEDEDRNNGENPKECPRQERPIQTLLSDRPSLTLQDRVNVSEDYSSIAPSGQLSTQA